MRREQDILSFLLHVFTNAWIAEGQHPMYI